MAENNDDLLTRTSWCNARHAQKEINRGRAHGNKAALWLRVRIQSCMFQLGCHVQLHYGKVLIMGMLILACLSVGLKFAVVETNVEKLWVEVGGRLQRELQYTTETLGLGEGTTNQIIIQTPKVDGANILTQEALENHLHSVLQAINVEVDMFGIQWDIEDVCYKPPMPSFEVSLLDSMLESISPCIIITPLDCFWEGAKLLGPKTPVFLPTDGLMDTQLRWTNLDPLGIIQILREEINYFTDVDALVEILKSAGVGHGYLDKPCLNPHDPECPDMAPNKHTGQVPNIGAEVTGGCTGFATKYMAWPEDLIVGGVKKNQTGHILSGEALQSIIQLKGETQMYESWRSHHKVNSIDWTADKAKDILEEWQRKFTEVLLSTNNATAKHEMHGFTETSFNDLLDEFSQTSVTRVAAGYVIMLIYACITMMKFCDGVQSQGGVGLGGVLLVATSVLAGLSVCAMLGIQFNASTTQVLPFLALGIGVDDMFLLAHSSTSLPSNIPVAHQTGEILKRSGVSVLLTSLNNMSAFLIAAIVPIPALRALSLQFAVVVIFNFIAVIFVFPAILALDIERRNAKRIDLFCCFTSSSANRVISVEPRDLSESPQLGRFSHYNPRTHVTLQSRVQAVTQMPARTGDHCVTVVDSSLPFTTVVGRAETPPTPISRTMTPQSTVSSASSTRPLTGLSADEEGPSFREKCANAKLWSWTLSSFAKNYYGPFLQKLPVKIAVLVFSAGLLGASAYGIYQMRDGLDITDIVPRGTKEYDFLAAQMKYFSFYNMFAVTQEEFDYPNGQKLLHEYHDAFREIKEVIPTPEGELPMFWLQLFRDWLRDLQEAFDRDWAAGAITQNGWFNNATEMGVMAYKLIIQTGDIDNPVDKTQVHSVRLVNDEGVIYPRGFYNYLTVWWSYDIISAASSQAELHPEPHDYYPLGIQDLELRIPKSQALNFTQLPFYLNNLRVTEDFIQVIKDVRNISEHFASKGLPNYPRGIPFTFWEQYVNLRFFLMLALISILGASFVVNTIILVNPWAATIEVLVLAAMIVELFGYMGLIGIKMSAIPAVTLIFSVGAGVEFTLHILLGFLTSIGDRNRRMCMALEHMFAPVVDGAISTLVGVVMLSGSEFEFIVRYFFYVFTGLIVIGLFNGLVFLPVLLSLIGPPAEVRPANDADRLSTPTPEPTPPLDRGFVMHSVRRQQRYADSPSDVSSSMGEGFRHPFNAGEHIEIHPPEFVVETLMCHTPPREKAKRMSRRQRSRRSRKESKLCHPPLPNQQLSSSSSPSSSPHSSPSLPRHVTTVTATARVSIVHRGASGVDKGESGHSYKSHKRRDEAKLTYPALEDHCNYNDMGSDTSV